MFGYISWARGNMATAAFFRDLRAWEFHFIFPSTLSIPILFEASVLVSGMMSSCFCEGTAHTSMENKHYSCFLFWVMLHFYSISLCSSLNVSDAGMSPVIPYNERVTSVVLLKQWSHISKWRIHGALSSLHLATCWGLNCTIVLHLACHVWLFSKKKKCEISLNSCIFLL